MEIAVTIRGAVPQFLPQLWANSAWSLTRHETGTTDIGSRMSVSEGSRRAHYRANGATTRKRAEELLVSQRTVSISKSAATAGRPLNLHCQLHFFVPQCT